MERIHHVCITNEKKKKKQFLRLLKLYFYLSKLHISATVYENIRNADYMHAIEMYIAYNTKDKRHNSRFCFVICVFVAAYWF